MADSVYILFRLGFQVMADDEFEEQDAKARAKDEAGVEQPEIDFGMRIARRGG